MENLIDGTLKREIFEPELKAEILKTGRLKRLSEGSIIIQPGNQMHEIPLVLKGTLRVSRKDDQDNEVFLYYLEGGDTCAASIACCIDNRSHSVQVVAEEQATLWMIPLAFLDHWLGKYASFRQFIFQAYQDRFDELLQAVDAIAFLKMDERLMKYLLDKKQVTGTYVIHKTHEQIAQELNTSRVVISRLLKKLEKEGKIEQYRNRIEIM